MDLLMMGPMNHLAKRDLVVVGPDPGACNLAKKVLVVLAAQMEDFVPLAKMGQQQQDWKVLFYHSLSF